MDELNLMFEKRHDDLMFEKGGRNDKIHFYFKVISSKRSLTTIVGMDDDLDLKRIAKAMKRDLNVSVWVKDDVIHCQGDQRASARDWMVKNEVMTTSEAESRVMFHGVN